MSFLSEAELLKRCRKGDEYAWNELFEDYYIATGRFVHQISSDFTREDVEEICQETFLTVIRNILSFQGNSQFQTWLFRIAANKAHDFIERKQAVKRGGGKAPISLQSEEEDGCPVDPPSPDPGPDVSLVNAENIALVNKALEQMGKPCREVIELRYYADLSYEEIAEELNLNPKTVSSRLSKCLDKLGLIAGKMFSAEKKQTTSV